MIDRTGHRGPSDPRDSLFGKIQDESFYNAFRNGGRETRGMARVADRMLGAKPAPRAGARRPSRGPAGTA